MEEERAGTESAEATEGAEAPAKQGMSRGRKAALVALALLPLLMTAVAQPFLPDSVAAHFGAGGVDRWEDKAYLFVNAGIMTTLCLVCIGFTMLYDHLRATNNGDWFVLDEHGGLNPVPFPLLVGVLVLFDAAFALYVGYNLFFVEGAPAIGTAEAGAMIADATFGLCVLAMWGFAAHLFLKKGGATNIVNGHPGTSERERKMGDNVRQSRAIGGLLLVLSFFVIVEWVLTRSGTGS